MAGADVAQPDQARIVGINAQHFLKNSGNFVISIKASCIDSTAPPEAVFAREVRSQTPSSTCSPPLLHNSNSSHMHQSTDEMSCSVPTLQPSSRLASLGICSGVALRLPHARPEVPGCKSYGQHLLRQAHAITAVHWWSLEDRLAGWWSQGSAAWLCR